MQSNAKEKIVEELVKGRESANQIRILLNEFVDRNRDDLMLSLDDLSGEILASLNSVFSILNDFEKWRSLENDRANSFDSKSKISEIKQRRGCYKRRRNCESWTMESACLENDGYAWRKYGQKVILNAKHPRNYYRCTHKFDKGCEATKQVQKISDDPPLYRIIYHNNHTCKIPSQNDSSFLLSFNSIKTEVAPQPRHEHPKPSGHILASPDRTALEASGLICGSDVISREVYSSTGSSHGKEVDYSYMMMDDGLFDVCDDGDDVFRLLDYNIW